MRDKVPVNEELQVLILFHFEKYITRTKSHISNINEIVNIFKKEIRNSYSIKDSPEYLTTSREEILRDVLLDEYNTLRIRMSKFSWNATPGVGLNKRERHKLKTVLYGSLVNYVVKIMTGDENKKYLLDLIFNLVDEENTRKERN